MSRSYYFSLNNYLNILFKFNLQNVLLIIFRQVVMLHFHNVVLRGEYTTIADFIKTPTADKILNANGQITI